MLNGVSLGGAYSQTVGTGVAGTSIFTFTGRVTGVSGGDVLALVLGPSGPPAVGWNYATYSRIQTA